MYRERTIHVLSSKSIVSEQSLLTKRKIKKTKRHIAHDRLRQQQSAVNRSYLQ